MIPEQWVSEIVSRFPYYSNKPESEQQALRSDLIDFADKKEPSLLDDLLSEFRITEFKRAPGIWWFYQRAKSTGHEDTTPTWRECDNGHYYSHKGNSCPICSSHGFKIHIGDSIPTDVIQVNDGCSECNWYEDGRGNMPRLYGPLCNEYGTKAVNTDQMCKDCKCADCCNLHYLNENDPDKYRERYGDIVVRRYAEIMEKITAHMVDKRK